LCEYNERAATVRTPPRKKNIDALESRKMNKYFAMMVLQTDLAAKHGYQVPSRMRS